ncbi:MAG: putative membrane protein [Planctomycetota bacterium]|jgi:uncharacterized membrane protein
MGAVSSPASAAQQGSFTDMGKLSTGTYSRLWSTSNDGVVSVGEADINAGANLRAAVWSASGG